MFMELRINNNLFNVKAVISKKDIGLGMMGKKFNGFDGMLFIMDSGEHSFWMKNCIIHLDILFIEDNVITKIHHNCKPCYDDNCERYSGYGDLVLELPGNSCHNQNIKVGYRIFF